MVRGATLTGPGLDPSGLLRFTSAAKPVLRQSVALGLAASAGSVPPGVVPPPCLPPPLHAEPRTAVSRRTRMVRRLCIANSLNLTPSGHGGIAASLAAEVTAREPPLVLF